MTPFISITRIPYEEPYHIHLKFEASNGRLRGQLEIYLNVEALTMFADALEVFPRHASDVHLWEEGSENAEDRAAYYFRIRLFTRDRAAHCAVQIRFNNNKDVPDRENSEFFIYDYTTTLKRLGKLLRQFTNLNHELLYWDGTAGKLFQTREELDAE